MKLLVTGVNGFVGSHVARSALARGWNVIGTVRPTSDLGRIEDVVGVLDLHAGDLTAPEFAAEVAERKPDACVHTAWFATPGEYLTSPENLKSLLASLSLAQALTRGGCRRLVGVGTCFEYGPLERPSAEADDLMPYSLYASCKVAASNAVALFQATGAMSTAWARLFYLYGPREDPRRLVPYVATTLLAGERAAVTSGSQVRDYLHVQDAADALVELAANELAGPVNVGSGQATTVRDVVALIAEIVGRPDLVDFGARPDNPADPPYLCANVARLLTTAWHPRFDLHSGLTSAVSWWRAQRG